MQKSTKPAGFLFADAPDPGDDAPLDRRQGRPNARRYPPGHPREPVILRTRMRRGLLNRIRDIAEWECRIYGETWNMSDVCREAINKHVTEREQARTLTENAGFTGRPPDAMSIQMIDTNDTDVDTEDEQADVTPYRKAAN